MWRRGSSSLRLLAVQPRLLQRAPLSHALQHHHPEVFCLLRTSPHHSSRASRAAQAHAFSTLRAALSAAQPPSPQQQPQQQSQEQQQQQQQDGAAQAIDEEVDVDQSLSKVKKALAVTEAKKKEADASLNFSTLVTPSKEEPPKEVAKKEPIYVRMWTAQFWKGVWQATKDEAHHYKVGFQLLWADTKIASGLFWRVLHGETLTRRERKQFQRTTSDLFLLFPLLVVIIVPGLEFALPFAIKIFPNILPSQFRHAKTENEAAAAQLKIKIEMAKFLQKTMDEMAVKAKDSKKASESQAMQEFVSLLQQGRTTGEASTESILKFSRLFQDDLTLDNLSYAQLKALCKLLAVPSYGTSAMMLFQIRMKLRQLKIDDAMIAKEGVASLSVQELQLACRERGMRAVGIAEKELRHHLQQWLDLHLEHGVPASLLLLSRIVYMPEDVPQSQRLMTVMESLPEAVIAQAKVELAEAEGKEADRAARLKVIASEEEAIKRERAEQKAQAEKAKKEELVDSKAKKPLVLDADLKVEDCIELVTILLELSGEPAERAELHEVQKDIVEYFKDFSLLQASTQGAYVPSSGSKKLTKRVTNMLERLEAKMAQLESNKKLFKELDLNQDGVISVSELMSAIAKMKNPPPPEKIQVLGKMFDFDHDGAVRLAVVRRVLALAIEEAADLNKDNIHHLVQVAEKEEAEATKAAKTPQDELKKI